MTKKVVGIHARKASSVGKFSFYSHSHHIIHYTVQVEFGSEGQKEKPTDKMEGKSLYSNMADKKTGICPFTHFSSVSLEYIL